MPGTVLAATEVDAKGHTKVLGGAENTAPRTPLVGMANLPTDTGGVIRKYYDAVGPVPSLAVQAVRSATGRSRSASTTARPGSTTRAPRGRSRPCRSSTVEKGTFDPADVRGKIVVVGASAPSLQDRHATPMSSELMAGPRCRPTRSGPR